MLLVKPLASSIDGERTWRANNCQLSSGEVIIGCLLDSLSERGKTKEQGSILRYITDDWWGAGREGLGRSSWRKGRGRAALWMGGDTLDGC
jgi:hypothetical protein